MLRELPARHYRWMTSYGNGKCWKYWALLRPTMTMKREIQKCSGHDMTSNTCGLQHHGVATALGIAGPRSVSCRPEPQDTRRVPFKAPQSKNDIEEAGSDEHGPGFDEARFHFGPPFRLRAVRHPSSDAHATWRHRVNFYLPLNFEARGSCVLSCRPRISPALLRAPCSSDMAYSGYARS